MSPYLFAELDVHIKFIPGRSAACYYSDNFLCVYLSTLGMGAQHGEIDFDPKGRATWRRDSISGLTLRPPSTPTQSCGSVKTLCLRARSLSLANTRTRQL